MAVEAYDTTVQMTLNKLRTEKDIERTTEANERRQTEAKQC